MERHISLLLCCLFAALSFSNALPLDAEPTDKPNYRLSDDIEAISYTINLRPYFNDANASKAFTFVATSEIEFKATKDNLKEITLHIKDLKIAHQEFRGNKIGISEGKHDSVTDKYTLFLKSALKKGQAYQLKFTYTGQLQTDMHGFYRSSYVENNTTKWLASTQFETHHARKVFPCLDEPRFKATFKLSIERPPGFKPSLANTKIQATTSVFEDGLVYTKETFYPTPKMSTYLLAFVVSEFKCRTNEAKTFQVCARPSAFEDTKYSFEIGQMILSELETLLDYPYALHGLGQLTMAAIPDFSAGAMENWGLLTYRETALLYDKTNPSKVARNRVAGVVAHEQAHMWFGDLVTCDWWEHTWLNEGFARFFQYFITAKIERKFQLTDAFVVEQVHTAFVADAVPDTHALSNEVNTPDEIGVMFDTITYNKGASVIRMLEHTLGHANFIYGLRKYLKTNEFNTAKPVDLYKSFQSSSVDWNGVEAFMNTWITQKGYPVVSVKVNENRTSAEITQTRFFLKNGDPADQTKWNVPLTYAHAGHNSGFNKTTPDAWLQTHEPSYELLFSSPVEWIVFNVNNTGFYRVEYDAETLKHIIKTLKTAKLSISVTNRAQIVDDALAFARSGRSTYVRAFDVLAYLEHEIDPLPWFSAVNHLNYIYSRYTPSHDGNFKAHISKLIKHVYHFVTHKNDTAPDYEPVVYNAQTIAYHACQFGLENCVNDAKTAFAKFTNENTPIPADLRLAYYCTGIRSGTADDWQKLWTKFEEENVSAEQVTILSALGCTTNHDLLTKYLDLILTNKVRSQDKRTAFLSTLRGRGNVDHVFKYTVDNAANITTAFGSDKVVPSLIASVAAEFTTAAQLKSLEEFAGENNTSKPLADAVKAVKYNLDWATLYIPAVESIVKPSPESPPVTEKPGKPGAASTITISFIAIGLVCLNVIYSMV